MYIEIVVRRLEFNEIEIGKSYKEEMLCGYGVSSGKGEKEKGRKEGIGKQDG